MGAMTTGHMEKRSLYAIFKAAPSPAKTTKTRKSAVADPPPSPTPEKAAQLPSSPTPKKAKLHSSTKLVYLTRASRTTLQLRQIHAQVLLRDFSCNSRITALLISLLSSHKSVHHSLSIFNHFSSNNLFTFNALIRGLEKNAHYSKAITYFVHMLRSSIRPDELTYPYVLKSAAGLWLKETGRALHGMILKCGNEFNNFVRICLVDMYVKVEDLVSALNVFDETPQRFDGGSSLLLWNILINGYCKVGNMSRAMELFESMLKRDTSSWNCLIDGFLKIGHVKRAKKLFDHMPDKNVISWTTMVNGLSHNGEHQKALSTFYKMMEEGVRPNDFTIVSALSACANLGALEGGLRIHTYIKENGFQLNGPIGNALLDMYAKCGNIKSARQVFVEIKDKDSFTWTIMIWGWAIHGDFEQAIQCFKQMMYSGLKPDGVVFLAILTACAHAGQVDLGLNFLNSMELDYSIEPTMKHYTLVVDLLGRAGRLEEALSFIQSMPVDPDFIIWGALFCACRAHKNTKMAELASQKLLELEPTHSGGYVFLSNVYAAVGRWDDAERVRGLMQERGVEKAPGWSYIEAEGRLHRFVAGHQTHKEAQEIYRKLEDITTGAKQQGYMPGTEWVLHNVEEEEKEDSLGSHSEKLALSFALIHTAPGTTIRIVKNLRVCGDCHSLMKYASKMSDREIVLRDIKRFHHFKDGVCSCRDFW